jgi:hypothetical protein
VDVKDIKCISMKWQRKYKFMFPIIGFLASKIIEDCWFLN